MAMKDQHFYICEHCGNLVGMIDDKGVPLVCCGEKMKKLAANTTDAAGEKHLPVVTVDGQTVTVKVGSAPHPMTEEHSILWIYLQTEHGGQRKALCPDGAPEAAFALTPDDKPIAAFAYCNLHSLWKTVI